MSHNQEHMLVLSHQFQNPYENPSILQEIIRYLPINIFIVTYLDTSEG